MWFGRTCAIDEIVNRELSSTLLELLEYIFLKYVE